MTNNQMNIGRRLSYLKALHTARSKLFIAFAGVFDAWVMIEANEDKLKDYHLVQRIMQGWIDEIEAKQEIAQTTIIELASKQRTTDQ
jgi:hypothetical protein